ncbi:MAG: hypothetical protein GY754_27495 [bacterium]|nr:hypothetical protein [bacterium]
MTVSKIQMGTPRQPVSIRKIAERSKYGEIYEKNGINEEQFDKLKEAFINLADKKQDELVKMFKTTELTKTEASKLPVKERIKLFLIENNIPIEESQSAEVVYDVVMAMILP